MSKLIAFLKNESGATAIEYGLIAAAFRLPSSRSSMLSALNSTISSRQSRPSSSKTPHV